MVIVIAVVVVQYLQERLSFSVTSNVPVLWFWDCLHVDKTNETYIVIKNDIFSILFCKLIKIDIKLSAN